MKTVFLKQNENSGWSVFHVRLAFQNGSSPQRLLKVEDCSCPSSSSILSRTTELVLHFTISSLLVAKCIFFTMKWGRDGKYSHYVWELSYVYNDCWHTDQLFWVCLFLHHGDFWKGDNRRWLERSLCFRFKIGTKISSSSRRTCNLHWRSWMIRLQRLQFSLYKTSLARDCKETRCVIK